jgi:uncharacterized SAM-binding protein YcdF (DUF218 family)
VNLGNPRTGRDQAIGPRVQARWPGFLARVAGYFALLLAAAIVAFAAGFLLFLWRIPAEEMALDRKADGIVVLTGGSSRITDALELLASGHGRRLLISGVYHSTSQGEIARLLPDHQKLIACCVDLDRAAVNTVGNAAGTRRWVTNLGFGSLIVVTSNYHMPRAMVELSHQLPDVTLIAYPVVALKPQAAWSNAAAARLLFSEYVKYIAAVLRIRFERVAAWF